MELGIVPRRRDPSMLAPSVPLFVSRRLFVCRGSALAAILTAAGSSSLNPTKLFAVTVIVVEPDRWLYFKL